MNQLRVGLPLAVGGTVLIPVERVAVTVERHRHGRWLSATKEAVAIVVCESDGLRALDVHERERPVDELIRDIPELAAVIGKCLAG